MQDPAPQKEELLSTAQAYELQELLAVASSKLHMNQQCALAAKRAHSLGCVNRLKLINSRLKDVINTLYSALNRLHPEYCIQFGTPQYKKTLVKLSNSGRSHQNGGAWSTCPVRRGWGTWVCSACRRDGFGGSYQQLPSAAAEPVGRSVSTQSQALYICWTAEGQGATGTI